MSFIQSKDFELWAYLTMGPPHIFWNFEKLGLLCGQGWEAVLLTSIPYTVNDGPWHGAGFLAQLSGAKQEYLRTSSWDTCPLFAQLLPAIARDQGRESELCLP